MNASLVLVKPDGSMREIPITSDRRVIGRGSDCNIRIPVAEVSRQHCEIRIDDEEDLVIVADLNSANGTFVNGKRVQEAELTPGDLLAIGPAVFVVRLDGFPADIDPAEAYRRGRPAPTAHADASPSPKPEQAPEGSGFFDDFDFSTDEDDDDKL